MSAGRAERILVQHFIDPDSMAVLAREGMPKEMIPNDAVRMIYTFAMDHYERSGMQTAPSIETLLDHYGNLLADNEIDIEVEAEDTIEYALDVLKGSWVNFKAQEFTREFAESVMAAEHRHRPDVIADFASRLVSMSTSLERRNVKSDMREDVTLRMFEYEDRVKNQHNFNGMRFGISAIDNHVRGIHPGELAILAGGPKTGKSWMLAWAALMDWRAGRTVVIYTLENSVEMTENRILCIGARVDYDAFQKGILSNEEIDRLVAFAQELRASPNPLYIFQPDLGKRTFEHMIATAMIYNVDSVFIDQLTFVELEDSNKSKTERIGEALHTLKGMISTGRRPIPVMLAHQINRDGVKAADKLGYLEMWHLADSAECERTADWVFGMYASRDDQTAMRCKFQTMATRRSWNLNWELFWNPYQGHVDVSRQIELV